MDDLEWHVDIFEDYLFLSCPLYFSDVIEDASGYVQTQTTSVQRDNVYDVMQN